MAKIGLQIYSVRTVKGTLLDKLEQVAAMGYDGVEFAGFDGYSAKELKAKLDEVGMVCLGSHTGLDAFRGDLAALIAYHKELGAAYINCPGLPFPQGSDEEKAAAWKALAQEFEGYGRAMAQAGMQFCYHNHFAEFDPIGQTSAEDILFTTADPALVKMELDTCWIEYTGLKAVDFMKKYPRHVGLLHIKELAAVHDGTPKVVGQGCIDFPAIVELGKQLNVPWFIVEHEATSGDVMAEVKACYNYLKSIM